MQTTTPTPMYYQGTIEAVEAEIKNQFPDSVAEYHDLESGELLKPVLPSYLLWMCEEVRQMDISSLDDATKAARWLGWINAQVEFHGLWHNNCTRDLVRADKQAGLHLPHSL